MIPNNYNGQYDINASSETWVVSAGNTLTSGFGHGISEMASYHDNVVQMDGSLSAVSNGSIGVSLQGDGSSVTVGKDGTIDAWHGIELFGDGAAAVNNGTITARGMGMASLGDNALTNNGIIKAFPGQGDVDGLVASTETDVVNNAGASIDVTGNGITMESLIGLKTEVSNFGTVIADGLSFYAFAGDDTLINRGTLDGNVQMGAGKDTFDSVGGKVVGSVFGGQGDDTYIVDGKFNLLEKPGEGTDEVRSSVSWTLGANFEDLVLTGSAKINGKGNGDANDMTGNSGKNKLSGLGGDDDLDGGKGSDILTGGAGADTFHFAKGYGKDVITDFENGDDVIDLGDMKGITDFKDLMKHHVSVSGHDVIIHDGADRLVIEDVKKSMLDVSDFDF